MYILNIYITDYIEYIPEELGNKEFNIKRIYRNEKWLDDNFPILEEFWNSLNYYRENGIENHPEYKDYYPYEYDCSEKWFE